MFSSRHGILADARAGMCAHCFSDALEELSKPFNESPHMHRMMVVPTCCRRCYNDNWLSWSYRNASRIGAIAQAFCSVPSPHADCWFDEPEAPIDETFLHWDDVFPPDLYLPATVMKEVFMPTEILAAAVSLVNKSGATAMTGTKPPNDWLQIANLVTQGKNEEDYAFALATVGAHAIIDEIACSKRGMTFCDLIFGGEVPDRASGEASGRCGMAWTRCTNIGAIEDRESEAGEEDDANRPNVAPPRPPPAPPPGLEEVVRNQTEIDEQMGAHINGTLLHSTVVTTEHGEHVQDNRTASGEVGARTARSRFPKTSDVKEYLFSNDPENLVSAEALRNVGVGEPNISPQQSLAFDEAVAALKKHLFTKSRIKKAERFVEKTTDVLPKNRTEEKKAQMHIDALNATGDETVPFSLLVDAFTKKEVSKKFKPRPIANHGDRRVWGMAKCSAIFEDVMFHGLPYACIKHSEKNAKMNEIFTNLEGYPHVFENDLTAFEFGIHERLKQAECDILKHIMKHLDLDADNAGFCHRVVDARTKACTWVLRYTDAAGAKCTLKLELPRAMRESGDRITSSGNFLQNLLAWITLMVKPGKVEAAIQSLVHNKGRYFDYISARDGRQYRAYLAFEGDDTVGGMNELILMMNGGQLINQFFTDYGWKAKLKVPSTDGNACVQFVGYTALLRDGEIVKQGANVVMFPEIKRILQDKPWSSTDIPDEEYHPSVAVYATCMANEFCNFGPMHAFFSAMRRDHIAMGGKVRKNNGMLRDIYIKMYGNVGTDDQVLSNVPDLDPFLDGGSDYLDLALVHAGYASAEEIAAMSGITTLEMHGRDLACFLPHEWRQ